MCVSFDKFLENWEETNGWLKYFESKEKELQQRIDKAIKYIKEKQIQNEYIDRCGFRVKENKWWLEDSDILLDILRGEDNEKV